MEKRLRRSRDDRMIAGVCAGMATYVGMDVTVLRVVFAGLALFSGGTFGVVYLLLWAIMPEERRSDWQRPQGLLPEEQRGAFPSSDGETASVVQQEERDARSASEDAGAIAPLATAGEPTARPRRDTRFLGWVLLAVGLYVLLSRLGWLELLHYVWPSLLIIIGLMLLWPRLRKG